MTRHNYQKLVFISQLLVLTALGLAIFWNVTSVLYGEVVAPPPLLILVGLPLPGWLLWIVVSLLVRIWPKAIRSYPHCYRLTYDTPAQWEDKDVRQALLNFIKSGVGLDIVWSRDGEEIGCWLVVSGFTQVLTQMISDIFPAGSLEEDTLPIVGEGVVILEWRERSDGKMLNPHELCRQPGIGGVYFRWLNERSAIVAVWGPQAKEYALTHLANSEDLLESVNEKLLKPAFLGHNPWPQMPSFPSSDISHGLASVSRVVLLSSHLRVNGSGGLVIGRDIESSLVGFSFPEMSGMRPVRIAGQATDNVIIKMVHQAIQAGLPVALLDGEGTVAARLTRESIREVAEKKVLICDVERPAQAHFRLNPLWLPGKDKYIWTKVLSAVSDSWLDWLRELGVTLGGLGQNAYRHTQVAVILTAIMAAERNLTLDPAALQAALEMPDFLAKYGDETTGGQDVFSPEIWEWWLNEGRNTPNFDVHLRLTHLRDRLSAMLELPEYGVLWRPDYLDPLDKMARGTSLIWRMPDHRQRLRIYISSQLVSLATMMAVWPGHIPVLVVMHELNMETWVKRLISFPHVRLVVSSKQVIPWWTGPVGADSMILSRLARPDANQVCKLIPSVRASDFRRLPENRLIIQHGQEIGTIDLID